MKRMLIAVFTAMALAVPLARAALASEAELSDVARPVDNVAVVPSASSGQASLAPRSPSVMVPPVLLPEPLRDENK